MSIDLNRVNSAPLMDNKFPYEFNQWVFNTIDTLNDNFDSIDNVLISQSLLTASTTSVDTIVNSLYIPTSNSLVSFQLPNVIADDIGSVVEIAGFGAGGWRIKPGTGASIKVSAMSTTVSTGSISSTSRYDAIKIILVDATTWITLSAQTTGFVIV